MHVELDWSTDRFSSSTLEAREKAGGLPPTCSSDAPKKFEKWVENRR